MLAVLYAAISGKAAEIRAAERGEKAFPNRAAWIVALIADLDQVDAKQVVTPGIVPLGDDPDINALIACGDDAIEPLLDCMEHDERMTKSVHWRFGMGEHGVRVSEAAFFAASSILKVSFFKPQSSIDDFSYRSQEDRATIIASVRAYWNKYKSLPIAERWFDELANDAGNPDEWMRAMDKIARPVDDPIDDKMIIREKWESIREPGSKLKMYGEVLRAKNNPSVTELASRRMEQIDRIVTLKEDEVERTYRGIEIAIDLSRWDPGGCEVAVERQLRRCIDLYKDEEMRDRERLIYFAADLADALGNAGDTSGLNTYGYFLRTMNFKRLNVAPADILAPIYKFRDEPSIGSLADWLFEDPSSVWNPIVPRVAHEFDGTDLALSPLLGIKSFREQIERGFADTEVFATITLAPESVPDPQADGHTGAVQTTGTADQNNSHRGVDIVVRWCDLYARVISLISGAPDFQFYWKQPQRDEAIQHSRQFLDRFGSRLGLAPCGVSYGRGKGPVAFLSYPTLNQCASQQEVDAGIAIFSLDGQGERRPVKLDRFPVKGKWITLKKYPYDEASYDVTGKKQTLVRKLAQDCWIWQAEELKVNGQWQRYYGVVGPHEIARVPASEIELNQITR
jgi:hypothetical protein